MIPAIFSLAGPEVTPDERALFREAEPAGYIVFARNCVDRRQLRALTDDLRAISGRDEVPVLIDQEGGRVARLKPPQWPKFPAAGAFDALYRKAPMSAIEAARANAQAMALLLAEAGVNVDCAPVLDLRHEGQDDIVGDRSFGADPMQVAALGKAMLDGLAAGGVAGCIKHVPGHGRARSDSHKTLPVVDAPLDALDRDFAPFRSLAAAAPSAMVAHILYSAIDPKRPASLSPAVIEGTIRGVIGFDGLLFSDDIAMQALKGAAGARAHAVVEAGCDLALHCSGRIEEMEEIAGTLGAIGPGALARIDRMLAATRMPAGGDYRALAEKRDALLAVAAGG
jgi:beta-N-acetylhexosaminidase